MKTSTVFISVLFTASLTGCAGWSRPNTSEPELRADRAQCQQEAEQAMPYRRGTAVSSGYVIHGSTSCSSSGSGSSYHSRCSTSPSYIEPPSLVTVDANLAARNQYRDQCMRARGYSFGFGSYNPPE